MSKINLSTQMKIEHPFKCDKTYFEEFSDKLLVSIKKDAEMFNETKNKETKQETLSKTGLPYKIDKEYFDGFYEKLQQRIYSLEQAHQNNFRKMFYSSNWKYYAGIAAIFLIAVSISVFYLLSNHSDNGHFSYENEYVRVQPLNKQQVQASLAQLSSDELTQTLDEENYLNTSYMDARFDEIENTLTREQEEQVFENHMNLLIKDIK